MSDKELLQKIMSETKYNQSQIAEFVGTSKQYIYLINKEKLNFSQKTKNLLKVKFPQFFTTVDLPQELTNESLKQYRISNGYSQRKFAELLCIHQSTLSHIEAGKENITDEIKDNFYRVFSKETSSKTVYYCPEVTIPNSFTLPKNPEVIHIDQRLLNIEKGLTINFNQTYLVSISGDALKPEYLNNDRVLLDVSQRSFKDGYTYFIRVNNQPYIRRVNVLPDKVKCIPFNNEQDAFYLEEKKYEIIGLIVPRIRL